jgi:DNA polymerase III alpha subunit
MKQLYTQLENRQLRFDGASVVSPTAVSWFLLHGAAAAQLRVSEIDSDVELFNANVSDEEQLKLPEEAVELDLGWQLPEPLASWGAEELRRYIAIRFELNCPQSYSPAQFDLALERLEAELQEIQRRGMTEFFKTIIYVLDVFREKKVVWGVGRGSSCASYILFILGLHSVDCVALDVPMEEFFHD